MRRPPLSIWPLTALALCAFASNSLLCRKALASQEIDPASFTAIRLFSGAMFLALILGIQRKVAWRFGSWLSAIFLFLYAAAFSFAYVGLTAGTGALILFGSVQATMISASIRARQGPLKMEWMGLCLALAGLFTLALPGLSSPPMIRAGLMFLAGVSWGYYSLRGQQSTDPIATTAGNFACAIPFAAILAIFGSHATSHGAMLAILSGALTSGLGYILWYAVLPSLGSTKAAIVQLSVPLLAALGGVLFLGEVFTPRMLIAACLTSGGVGLVLAARSTPSRGTTAQ